MLLFADSDVIFLKPFEMRRLTGDMGTRLFRAPAAVHADMAEHVRWHENTAAMLAAPMPAIPADDYVTHLASWRSANVLAMIGHLEQVSGRDWVSAVSSYRRFSEYMIYGRFVDVVLPPGTTGHEVVDWDLARSFWSQDDIATRGLERIEEQLQKGQVAVGVQSFLGEPIERLRRLFDSFEARTSPLPA